MLNRRNLLLTATAFGLGWSLPAQAHRMPMSSTEIVARPKAAFLYLDFTHRMPIHDALSLFAARGEKQQIRDLRDFARMGLYYEKAFQLRHRKSHQPLTPKAIGGEVIDDYFFLYQELQLPRSIDLAEQVEISSQVLAELARDRLHHINITLRGKISSLTFTGKGKWRPLLRR